MGHGGRYAGDTRHALFGLKKVREKCGSKYEKCFFGIFLPIFGIRYKKKKVHGGPWGLGWVIQRGCKCACCCALFGLNKVRRSAHLSTKTGILGCFFPFFSFLGSDGRKKGA